MDDILPDMLLPNSCRGFRQHIEVYVGLHPDPKCYRAIKFMKAMQWDVTVLNETHPISNGECPYIVCNGQPLGGWNLVLQLVGRLP